MRNQLLLNTSRALTLLELMLVVVIAGILAAVTLPMFPKAIENSNASEAVAGLEQIRTGQRLYRVEENTYWGPSTGSGVAEIQQINDRLRVFLETGSNRRWNYDVDLLDSMTFRAKAIRRSGSYQGGFIRINQAGTFDGTWPLSIPGN